MTEGSRVWFGPLPRGRVARSKVKSDKKERTWAIQNVQRCTHEYKIQNVKRCTHEHKIQNTQLQHTKYKGGI